MHPWRARVRFVLYGIISVTIALWLMETTTVSGFPISITICDSLGGLVLGIFFVPVGEWAKRKGHTYGTIVVDPDRACPPLCGIMRRAARPRNLEKAVSR